MRTTSKPSWLTEMNWPTQESNASSTSADSLFPGAETTTSELSLSRLERWRARLRRLGVPARRVLVFGWGVAAALAAVLLYNAFVPAPHQITTREVSDTVAKAIASATPLPAYSEQV